jgi:hypothetical protein
MNRGKIILITLGVVAVIMFALYWLFGWVNISVGPGENAITIDGNEYESPHKGFMFVGSYKLSAKASDKYHLPLEKELQVKPGINKYSYELPSKRSDFIETLPVYDVLWDIDYNQKQDKFFVLIKDDPYLENKKKAISYLESKGIDTSKENISWNSVAGVNYIKE